LEKPLYIATDGAFSYFPAIRHSFKTSQHYRYIRPKEKDQMQIMERLNGNIKQRTKTMRGMWCGGTAKQIIDFCQVHYNFIRPHSALHNRTPAEVVGIVPHWSGNKWEKIIEVSAVASQS
jgi:hypothetical protein